MKFFTQIDCRFTRTARRDGPCLTKALELIARRPELKLMQGPPGRAGDTSHFWTVDPKGMIVDPAADLVPRDYGYVGRVVDPSSVREELAEPLSDYMRAVEEDDAESLQTMIHNAASSKGYNDFVKHATPFWFTKFDRAMIPGYDPDTNVRGFHVGSESDEFSAYVSDWSIDRGVAGKPRIMELFMYRGREIRWKAAERMVHQGDETDGFPQGYDTVVVAEPPLWTPEIQEKFDKDGVFMVDGKKYVNDPVHGGVDLWSGSGHFITGYSNLKEALDPELTGGTHFIVNNPSQLKSADLVTYDDQGTVIPLEKRFDKSNPDIRY
jgi:hypothetical protein